MKNKKFVWLPICWLFYILLIIVAFVIPGSAIKYGTTEQNISLFSIFGSGFISAIEKYGSNNANILNSLLLSFTFFVPTFFAFSNKPICKYISLAVAFTLFAFVLSLVKEYSTLKDRINSNYSLTIPGLIIIFIASLFSLILELIDIFYSFFFDKLSLYFTSKNKNSNTLSLLQENKEMLEKGFISQEEYENRRKKILGE